LKIYKEYGVNPVGGCLPLLIQMPLFLGFYYMLQSSIELRHASLAGTWIHDLSMPDTVYSLQLPLALPLIGSVFHLNPMPLLMAVTMYISMHMTPQPQGVDNPAQKIIKFMPLMFLLFCYGFASALSLYWTVQNLLSIFQMYINSKTPLPTLEQMKAQVAKKRKKKK
jgi:YidC/Oxa1 family membrane protein insertase